VWKRESQGTRCIEGSGPLFGRATGVTLVSTSHKGAVEARLLYVYTKDNTVDSHIRHTPSEALNVPPRILHEGISCRTYHTS